MSCSKEYCTCYNNPDCPTLVACVQKCNAGDQKCLQTCLTASPNGISDAFLVGNCSAGSCAAQCPAATKSTPCEACLFQQCPAAMNKCLSNAECTNLVQCASACNGDQGCQLDCFLKYSGGANDAMPVQNCSQGMCAAQCM
jgi:hypothetical protein